jgi:hypothetical protein
MSAVPHVIFRRTRKLLRELSEEGPDLWKKTWPSEAARLLPYFTERRKNEKQKATQKRKLQGALAARAGIAEIRAAVMVRAGGQCEGCLKRWGWSWTLDHFLGGAGRRKEKESIETCWALCGVPTGPGCHGKRTRNEPSAAHWNDRFREHCERYGYPVVQHVEHARLPGRAS